eukprot:GHVH01007643.1.p1 GENE.GHVH01007643.1~~GHVH01007643.1.p1  ORF type:complete len:426 (+),score=47.75 GHVH01007643.1:87-1364(+)
MSSEVEHDAVNNETIPYSIPVRVSRTCPDPWTFWKEVLKSPKRVLAPMVDQSELPFRILCRRRGVDLTYSPMMHAKLFASDPKYVKRNIPNFAEGDDVDRPFFAHFCANDPEVICSAVETLKNDLPGLKADAIDLNFGCPQGIAKKGNYGSFLLSKPDLMVSMVKELDRRSHLPITCKIRLVDEDDIEATISLVKRLENAGAAVICVHGRTKENKSQIVTACDWSAIRRIKEAATIPIIANGGVESYEDAIRCEEATKADAVMSAIGLLEYPSLFKRPMEADSVPLSLSPLSNHEYNLPGIKDTRLGIDTARLNDMDDIIDEYLDLCEKYPPKYASIKAHLFHMMHSMLQRHPEMRQVLGKTRTLEDARAYVEEMKLLRSSSSHSQFRLEYYRRYRSKPNDSASKKRPAEIKAATQSKCIKISQS